MARAQENNRSQEGERRRQLLSALFRFECDPQLLEAVHEDRARLARRRQQTRPVDTACDFANHHRKVESGLLNTQAVVRAAAEGAVMPARLCEGAADVELVRVLKELWVAVGGAQDAYHLVAPGDLLAGELLVPRRLAPQVDHRIAES